MTAELTHYCWDRLLRALARGATMTQAQKVQLADFVSKYGPADDLGVAVKALVSGTLTNDAAVAGYKAHRVASADLDAVRKSLTPTAPAPGESVDARIASFLST